MNRPPQLLRRTVSEKSAVVATTTSEDYKLLQRDVDTAETSVRVDDSPILTLPVKSFCIGKLICKSPTFTRFYGDRLEYSFHHPFNLSEVLIIMFYRDMTSLSMPVHASGGRFSFRIPKRHTVLLGDFDPANKMHVINLELTSNLAAMTIKQRIVPIIQSRKQGL